MVNNTEDRKQKGYFTIKNIWLNLGVPINNAPVKECRY